MEQMHPLHILILPAKWWLLVQESFWSAWAEVYQCRS